MFATAFVTSFTKTPAGSCAAFARAPIASLLRKNASAIKSGEADEIAHNVGKALRGGLYVERAVDLSSALARAAA